MVRNNERLTNITNKQMIFDHNESIRNISSNYIDSEFGKINTNWKTSLSASDKKYSFSNY